MILHAGTYVAYETNRKPGSDGLTMLRESFSLRSEYLWSKDSNQKKIGEHVLRLLPHKV